MMYILFTYYIHLYFQLSIQAAMHALGNIFGESRSENDIVLNDNAEENLQDLIYQIASRSSKMTPSVSQEFRVYFF